MEEERDALMSHTWPALRRFCRERQVELVEVDLRWGIPEEHSTRKETLKLCLDEIRACRPFFIGLLGERYGWVPRDEAITTDLLEEEPWLANHRQKSVTELEILHGVLNNPEMAGRAFFYFRDPAYAQSRGEGYFSDSAEASAQQATLKTAIQSACARSNIPLRERYPDPAQLAQLVLDDLQAAIDADYPTDTIPDPLTREARDHETFAEIRRRTYISRPEYYQALDQHANSNGNPLVLLGDSGSGKSALLANWIDRRRTSHPHDFIVQHHIGSTPDSADHWQLMRRIIAEVKRWTDDPEDIPRTHDDLLKTFPVWLAKARSKAEHEGVRFIVVLDALNQLEDRDHARLLGWLPSHQFTGSLRLIVSTLPGDTLQAAEARGWPVLHVEPLTPGERRRIISDYLARFSKQLDAPRLERLAAAPAAANPLYLKILLDELRVTGTHKRLDERLDDYLAAADIPALLKKVLARYQRDYEHDRPGLVGEALGLIWAARRGLTETELLRLLRPADLPQLPLNTWAPLRAALEDLLVDRGGILNFVHDFLRAAVETAFVPDQDRQDDFRIQLADDFENEPVTARSCEELPWLLWQAQDRDRLRACLLGIERFLLIQERDPKELMHYWVWLKEEPAIGGAYVAAFETWSDLSGREPMRVVHAASELAYFLNDAALHTEAEPLNRLVVNYLERSHGPNSPNVATALNNLAGLLLATNRLAEAEPLMRRALAIDEQSYGPIHSDVARDLNNLAGLLLATNRPEAAEPLMRRTLAIDEQRYGPAHPRVATRLNNLASLLQDTNRLVEAEPLMRRALAIDKQSYGPAHPNVARDLSNLAQLLKSTNRSAEAEPLMRCALAMDEQSYGPAHPKVATDLNNLALLLKGTSRLAEAEPLYQRALAIDEQRYGLDHPNVATDLNNLASLFQDTSRLAEAEPLYRRALAIDEQRYGLAHPHVARDLNNLASLFQDTNRLAEAELLYRHALAIDEQHYDSAHPDMARVLSNLAQLLKNTNRLGEAEPLLRRVLDIFLKFTRVTGHPHPNLQAAVKNYVGLLKAMGQSREQILWTLREMSPELFQ